MIIQRETAVEAMKTGFRMYAGQGRVNKISALSSDTGINESSLKGYRDGTSLPSWIYGINIMANMPPEFAMAILAPTGLRVQPGEEEEATLHELAVVWSASLHAHSINMLDGSYTEAELRSIYPLVKQANMESSRCLSFLHKSLGLSEC